MDKKIFLALIAFLFLASQAFAFADIDGNRVSGAALSSFSCVYERNCVKVSWDPNSSADFNNVRIITEGPSEKTTTDHNFSASETEYYYCTVAPGETFSAIAYRYNQDIWGNYHLNTEPDQNCTIQTGTAIQGAQYLFYNVFWGLGSTIILIILVAVVVLVLAATKLKIF